MHLASTQGVTAGVDWIRQCILEYSSTMKSSTTFADSFLETALYIEDAFGITLADEEIDSTILATPELVVTLVKEKLKCAESAE